MAPAFQDFGPLSEWRNAERQQKKKKRILIASSSAMALVLMVAIGTVAAVHFDKIPGASKSTDAASTGAVQVHAISKSIDTICASTDYKGACKSSLTSAVNTSGSSDPQPKDLVKAAIAVISAELAKAFNHSTLLQSDDPKVKDAVEVCKEVFNHAMDELQSTIHIVDANDLAQIPSKSPELKNWLSAVISYQQTCVDAFPEGELKTKMEDAVKLSKQLTSNALAIVTEAASLLSLFDVKSLGLRRRLLEDEVTTANVEDLDSEGLPSWMSEGERRILKEKDAKKLKPNVIVAKDGSGSFKTITDALAAMPKKYKGRYIIYVKAGVYEESPTVTKDMQNVTMYGDGSRKTIVTGAKNFVDGTPTFKTATFVATGDGFMAIAMGFRNTAGAAKHQAVALRVQSDRSIFLNCRMEGFQDTLYAQVHRQYYRSCVIAGTIDFIFGDAAAVFQNCDLVVLRPLDSQQNIVTAQGRMDRRETTGFVLHSCKFLADPKLTPDAVSGKIRSYLARPWKEYSRTVIMESTIGGFIHPDGYMPWEGQFALKTLYYAEYANTGPGAALTNRVKWPGVKVIRKDEAKQFTVDAFIQGGQWIGATGTPVHLGLFKN